MSSISEIEYIHLLGHAHNCGRDWYLHLGDRDAPLSGEWAGESMTEIGERYDIDLYDSDLADAFEEGFYAAQSEASDLDTRGGTE